MKVIKKILVMLLITMMMINVIPVHAATYKDYKKGDKIKVKVNDTTSLEFYVLADSGTTSDSVKAIYSGVLEGKVEYDDINVALTTLKGVWKNASNITLPTMTEIFGSGQDLSKAFEYNSPSWALSSSRYWTSNKVLTSSNSYKTLGTKILEDNKETTWADNIRSEFVDSDTGIDFSKNSFGKSIIVGGHDGEYVPKNGKGLYYTATNTQDGKTTYYFRGAVNNNYVKFADYYWKIMRINEDGSIRLIFNGNGEIDTNDRKQEFLYPIRDKNVVLDMIVPYNSLEPAFANYVGYMHNFNVHSIGENSDALHTNETDSSIKKYLDEWYTENLETYSKYISGTAGFCNDRTYTTNEDNATYHSTIIRTNNHTPKFSCTNIARDLFTTDTIGNSKLTKPIGLPTVDDLMYAGGVYKSYDPYSYLYSADYFWTMSPGEFVSGPGSAANMFIGASGGITATHTYIYAIQNPTGTTPGNMEFTYSNGSKNVRPVINLKATVEVSQGDGTHDNPYMINTSESSSTAVEVAWTLGGSPKGTAQTEVLTETLSIKPVITISKEYIEQLNDDGKGDVNEPGDVDEPQNPETSDNIMIIICSTLLMSGLVTFAYKRRKTNN